MVHSAVDLNGGSTNKNIGDCYLIIWKFPKTEVDSFDEELTIKPGAIQASQIADMAVMGYISIIAKINKYDHILEYSANEEMNKRVANYRVRMGFGLHTGWAIEGAIGSRFKIDASYLSPNVNISSRLEMATQ